MAKEEVLLPCQPAGFGGVPEEKELLLCLQARPSGRRGTEEAWNGGKERLREHSIDAIWWAARKNGWQNSVPANTQYTYSVEKEEEDGISLSFLSRYDKKLGLDGHKAGYTAVGASCFPCLDVHWENWLSMQLASYGCRRTAGGGRMAQIKA